MVYCLCCQGLLENGYRYHPKCLKNLFGKNRPPSIPFGLGDVRAEVIKTGSRMSLSGVQKKLSVRVNPDTDVLETVARGGTHILKPSSTEFPDLPQNENACMNMAEGLNMRVPPHGLFPMADGTLCYIVKRFDRLDNGTKLAKETMFQILGSEDKYVGSLEQVGKAIRKHVTNIGLDAIDFFERVLFCFLTGNGDMHQKNWALITRLGGSISLAPCYDFVSSKVYLPEEGDTALTINGKRHKLTREDFDVFATSLQIAAKPADNVFQKIFKAKNKFVGMCASSELSPSLRDKLIAVIENRHTRLFKH